MAPQSIEIAPGAFYYPGYLDRAAQEALLADIRAVIAAAPLYHPRMPRSGKPLLGAHDELRAARLGLGHRRLPLPGNPSRDRRALARRCPRR